MDSACISTLAALGGALIRGLTSFAASDEGSKLHADSLIHDAPDVSPAYQALYNDQYDACALADAGH